MLSTLLACTIVSVVSTYDVLTFIGYTQRYKMGLFIIGFFAISMFVMAKFEVMVMGLIAFIVVVVYSISLGVYDCRKSKEEMERLLNE